MSIQSFFDTVDQGISDAVAFEQKMVAAAEAFFGAGSPQAAAVASVSTALQQEVAKVKIVVGGVQQAMVMTPTVYDQIIAGLDKFAGISAGETFAQKVASVVEMAATDGLQVFLTVEPGLAPFVMLGENIVGPLVSSLIAKYL